jgi:nucleotide-binding universal stress UspA family protein
MFEKVLVCLDGSRLSEQIMPKIMEEARAFGKVVLLRVIPNPDSSVPLGVPGVPGIPMRTDVMLKAFEEEVAEAPKYLEGLSQQLRVKGVDVECVVLQGRPNENIVEYAQENHFGLIAIATHGHGGLRRVIFGSTAEYVLKNSGVPVLVIRPKE